MEKITEMLLLFHTIIQTCRMMGVKVLKYLQSIFKKFSEDCRYYSQMLPCQATIDKKTSIFSALRKTGYSKVSFLRRWSKIGHLQI